MENQLQHCPCKRLNCKRHGDCAACRAHHAAEKKHPPACERKERKPRTIGKAPSC